MNDSALMSRRIIDQTGGLQHVDLDASTTLLRRTLHNRDGYRQPLELVAERLRSSPAQTGRRDGSHATARVLKRGRAASTMVAQRR